MTSLGRPLVAREVHKQRTFGNNSNFKNILSFIIKLLDLEYIIVKNQVYDIRDQI